MADKGKGLYRLIALVFDSAESRKATKAMEDALARAGQIGGQGFRKELAKEYNRAIADAKTKLASGLIDQKTFDRIKREADVTFNQKFSGALRKLKAEGKLLDDEFVTLSRSLKRVGDDGEKHASRIGAAFKKAAVWIGSFFVVGKIRDFLEDSVKEAIKSEQTWNNLRSTVENAGVSFRSVEKDLRATADQWARMTRYGDDEFAATLQRLIAITGNYDKSLQNVVTVAGVAARYHKSLEEAATLVGKAINGVTTGFGRLGIKIPEGTDALVFLQSKTREFVGQDLESLDAKLAQLNVAWGDYKKAIGFAILGQNDAKDSIGGLTQKIREQTEWVNKHRDLLHALGTTALWVITSPFRLLFAAMEAGATAAVFNFYIALETVNNVLGHIVGAAGAATRAISLFFGAIGAKGLSASAAGFAADIDGLATHLIANANMLRESAMRVARNGLAKPAAKAPEAAAKLPGPTGTTTPTQPGTKPDPNAAKKIEDELDKQAAALGKLATLHAITAGQQATALQLEIRYTQALENGNLTLEQRERIAKRIADLRAATFGLGGDRTANVQNTTKLEFGKIRATGEGGLIAGADTERQKVALQTLADYYRDSFREIQDVATNAAMGMANAWQDAFGLLFQEGATVGKFFEKLGRGIAGSLLGGLAQLASGMVAKNIAQYFDDLAAAATASAMAVAFPWIAPQQLTAAALLTASAHGHLITAAKWAVLGGLAGAAQGAVSGGGSGGTSGGIPSGATDIGGRIADNTQPRGPEINIYVDGFDPHNPHHQDMVGYSQQELRERWGEDSTIHYYPRTGG